MEKELERIGIGATRQRSFPWKEIDYRNPKYQVMYNRTPGAIGCHLSQVEVMKKALQVEKHAFVMEDDLIFCDDLKDRLKICSDFLLEREWDVLWLGATFHVNPPYWHVKGKSNMPPNCSAQLGKDAERTDHSRIMRTYGAFSTYAYIVNKHSIKKILDLFDKHVHESIGIDWLFIKLQPQLKCFAFVPGCVKQMDNQSDIGSGITKFSGFANLGPYWFQPKMNDFDPLTFNWAEC